ncbi:MAG: hypothetical protein JSR39_07910 [Verrucomicrobia bacterium]|nr:hypothetical protein [Verrucomicrobiota bacterium]
MQINLHSDHLYKDWKIASQELLSNSNGREYKIVYEKDQDILERICKLVIGIFLIACTLGHAAFFNQFPERFNEAFQTKLIDEATSTQSLESYILEKIDRCPCVQRLYAEALAELQAQTGHTSLGIRFHSSNSSVFPEGSRGLANFSTGHVELQFGIEEDELTAIFIFELTNFKQVRRFYEINARLHSGQFSTADEYAMECERVEYEGIHMHHRIVQEAISTNLWNSNLDIYHSGLQNEYATFEDYWNHERNGPHVNYHRESFYRVYGRQAATV